MKKAPYPPKVCDRECLKNRAQTTIRLPAELKEQLQQEADMFGISFNAYVLILIDKGHRN